MKLYEVQNGYIGYNAVHVLVVCETEERALELAAKKFKKEYENHHATSYEPDYYTPNDDWSVEELCSDLQVEWCSDRRD